MAFRKRNVGIQRATSSVSDSVEIKENIPGVRPSPLTGQLTTSTGAYSLDGLLGGHAGLALGSSVLIEESGTTDFAGALLRYYAAEGITQGHTLHIVGGGEQWIKELPGLVGAADAAAEAEAIAQKKRKAADEEKMKIAWRYERLNQTDADRRVLPNRAPPSSPDVQQSTAFCHTFDLAKRLVVPTGAPINHIPISKNPMSSPFDSILKSVSQSLVSSPANTVHRLVISTLLSPALYPPHASLPQHFLGFLHSLRALLRQHPSRLTAMLSFPLSLYGRQTALVRWAETLSDGVLELTPFPHLMDASNSLAESGGTRSGVDEQPQGMFHTHKLPVNTDRGGGVREGDDLAFTVSRRRFVIKPFSLPPAEGDTEAQQMAEQSGGGGGAVGKATKVDIEF
ncbi:hypothetical protein AAFC00_001960 [Neodothiora populina]|uniref:Elongator complex protein 4 n=1 Tax=Neodothiora populina TaxID=2781224 RepID=A0ABR3PR07_9PEZI